MGDAMKTAVLSLSAIALLTACGGGATSNNPVASYTTLQVFNDGAGVARGTGNDGSQALVITPDVTEVVAEANTVTGSDIAGLQVSDFAIVQSLGTNANLRSGALTTNGVTMNILAVEDLGGEAGIILAEIPNYASIVMVTGTQYGSAPSGTFTYSGTMGMGPRTTNATAELGSFTMSANFSNQTFTYNGTTTSNSVSGSGVLDTTNGRFATNSLAINTNNVSRTGTMYGQMHGSTAKSVSGVFNTNETSPFYTGAFVGSR
jgi:hypothetical protein